MFSHISLLQYKTGFRVSSISTVASIMSDGANMNTRGEILSAIDLAKG